MGISQLGGLIVVVAVMLPYTVTSAQEKGPSKEAIERCQAELADAVQKKAIANEKIQTVYRATEKMFDQLRTEGASLAILDISRVLKESVAASRIELGKAKRPKARQRALASFGQAVENEMIRLESAALKRIPMTIAATAVAIWSEAAGSAKLPSNTDLSTITFQRIASEMSFWTPWNNEVANDLPETKSWVHCCAQVSALEEQLMVLKDPKMAFSLNAPD